jgi:hypothetical protein
MKKQEPKAILVTTIHRGVFFGFVDAEQDMTAKTMALKDARCAIYWGTTKGVAELASAGPNSKSRIGDRADIAAIHDITAIWDCTPEAVAAWTR